MAEIPDLHSIKIGLPPTRENTNIGREEEATKPIDPKRYRTMARHPCMQPELHTLRGGVIVYGTFALSSWQRRLLMKFLSGRRTFACPQ